MDLFFFIVLLGVGVVLGMYIASQISEHIDSRTQNKKFMRNLKNFYQKKHDRK